MFIGCVVLFVWLLTGFFVRLLAESCLRVLATLGSTHLLEQAPSPHHFPRMRHLHATKPHYSLTAVQQNSLTAVTRGLMLRDNHPACTQLQREFHGNAAQRQLHSSYSSAATAQHSTRWPCSAAPAALRAQSSSAFHAQMGITPCMAPICV